MRKENKPNNAIQNDDTDGRVNIVKQDMEKK